jgi:dephospho-CoA kinase
MKKIYLGLVGEAGSGKNTVADFLEKQFGAQIVTSSYLLKKAIQIFISKIGRADYIWFVEKLTEKYGEDIISKAVVKNMQEFSAPIVVFNGVRLPSDYEMLKKIGGILVYVTADSRVRWQRVQKRGEKSDDRAPFEEFMAMHSAKTEINVPKIGLLADYQIKNDGSLADLEKATTLVIEKIEKA